ncbi:hypothetical protein GWI33_007884 [Rhynchophorus ferrugineus]|uniref:DUF4794 domain-containing protein n=1 Tax=Rhynchophorus ferrugineus TaxID=354439 RepID=A0A834IS45_RHYFE|nr:hypothetical protein GWI33_007884 [Rhynchophorus ferrugineus]
MRISIFILLLSVAGLSFGKLGHRHRPRKFGGGLLFKSNRLAQEVLEEPQEETSEAESSVELEPPVQYTETVEAPGEDLELKEPPAPELAENPPEEAEFQGNEESFVETTPFAVPIDFPIIYPDQPIYIEEEAVFPAQVPYSEQTLFPEEEGDDLTNTRIYPSEFAYEPIYITQPREMDHGIVMKAFYAILNLKKQLLFKLEKILRNSLIIIKDLFFKIISILKWFLS